MSFQLKAKKSPAILPDRIRDLDWEGIHKQLWERGYAKTPAVLSADECTQLIKMYPDNQRFRSRVDMARYRFGLGEYKYFANPLPYIVSILQSHVYTYLAPIANKWNRALDSNELFPEELDAFLRTCATHGQLKPSPLLLQYKKGDFNCLHQDLLGEIAFPFQLTCALSQKDFDYTGGEFLLIEKAYRGQSQGEVVTVNQGECVIFTTNWRPLVVKSGFRRAQVRHGVSRITSGHRFTLGIIFHNSK